MKHLVLASALALAVFASTPADAGNRGSRNNMTNVNVNLDTGRGGLLGAVLGTLRGHNAVNLNANVKSSRGGLLGTILGGR